MFSHPGQGFLPVVVVVGVDSIEEEVQDDAVRGVVRVAAWMEVAHEVDGVRRRARLLLRVIPVVFSVLEHPVKVELDGVSDTLQDCFVPVMRPHEPATGVITSWSLAWVFVPDGCQVVFGPFPAGGESSEGRAPPRQWDVDDEGLGERVVHSVVVKFPGLVLDIKDDVKDFFREVSDIPGKSLKSPLYSTRQENRKVGHPTA